MSGLLYCSNDIAEGFCSAWEQLPVVIKTLPVQLETRLTLSRRTAILNRIGKRTERCKMLLQRRVCKTAKALKALKVQGKGKER